MERRPPTPQERAVLERLLSVDFPDAHVFRAQVAAITVTGMCGCGCGSLELEVDPARAPRAPSAAWRDGPDVIVEGDTQSWLMLFQDDGWLTELEHVDGYGPRPQDMDAASIRPHVQVDEEWLRGG